MLISYLVDSDWIIDSLHGRVETVRTLAELAPAGLAISVISYAEVYQGACYSRNPETDMADFQRFLVGKELLDLTLNILERFAKIRGGLSRPVKEQVGDFDLLIAATAIEHGLVLLTGNVRDFRQISELRLFDAGASVE